MSHRRAFTWVEALVVVCILAAVVAVLLPALGAQRRTTGHMPNSANLRGIAQSFAIFGNSNNDFLPGLSSSGEILSSAALGSPVGAAGATTGASNFNRLWVLLNGQYIGADLLINPQDSLTKWVSGSAVSAANCSYAGLQIGDSAGAASTANHQGRAMEWKNNANSQAVMMSDRLLVAGESDDAKVQSVWTTIKGDWKGNLVWGDVHAEFAQTNWGLQTQYGTTGTQPGTATMPAAVTGGVTNTNDNLFVTSGTAAATDNSAIADANAMLIYF